MDFFEIGIRLGVSRSHSVRNKSTVLNIGVAGNRAFISSIVQTTISGV